MEHSTVQYNTMNDESTSTTTLVEIETRCSTAHELENLNPVNKIIELLTENFFLYLS